MRLAPLGVVALVVGSAGCLADPPRSQVEDKRYVRLLDSPAAMHCVAGRREQAANAEELELEAREQRRLVRRLKVRVQEAFGEAGRVRSSMTLPKTVREAEALNLEGEGRRLREEVRNRERLIGVLDERAAWARRRAHRESHRIDQIMHKDLPGR